MSIQDLQAEDLDLIFSEDEFAVPATYTPSGGSAVSLLVILQPGENLDDAQWKAALQATAVLWVKTADVVDPGYQDTVTVDEVEWTVAKIVAKFGRLWKLEVRRDLRPTFRK